MASRGQTRVLLIGSNRFRSPYPVIPFGLCCVARALRSRDVEVHLADLCFSARPDQDVAWSVQRFKPSVIGVGIRNLDRADALNSALFVDELRRDVVEPARRVFPGPIVIGGAAVGINAVELLERLERGEPVDEVPGLVWRQADGTIRLGGAPSLPASTRLVRLGSLHPDRLSDRPRGCALLPSLDAR